MKIVYQAVDFSGDALWNRAADQLSLTFGGDFLLTLINVIPNEYKSVIRFATLIAPLGENSFVAKGDIAVQGQVSLITESMATTGNLAVTTFVVEKYDMLFTLTGTSQDLVGVTGFIEASWNGTDNKVHYGGRLYF